ncbi:MAG: Fe-S protein assembly co-chaperone HscB [Burkholderiales bacterium]|nr:Fe-S protein assembly co-chaperone HscB [Burkholderiales bacterium]
MNLQSSDFELFGLPERFAQDRAQVDARWKELQREAHPDKFAAQGGAAQRLALQWSVRINEAYNRLKDPLRRAAYLCQLRGAPIEAEKNTAMPADFLVEQMEWREELEAARGESDLDGLRQQLEKSLSEHMMRVEDLLDAADDPHAAAQQVRALMFIERFGEQVESRLEQLGQ